MDGRAITKIILFGQLKSSAVSKVPCGFGPMFRIRASLLRCRQHVQFANGFSRWKLPEGPSAAEAGLCFAPIPARLKSCPDTNLALKLRHLVVSLRMNYLAITTVVQELLNFGRSRFAAIRIFRVGRSPRTIGQ